MVYIKNYANKRITQCILAIEFISFTYVYLYGSQGISELMQLRSHNALFAQELTAMNATLTSLQEQIKLWEHDQFLPEKIAREELQMARKGEEIYYLTSL